MSGKMQKPRKKGLRVSVTNRRTPLTGGANKHQRGAKRATRQRDARLKSEVIEAGRAKEVRAHTVIFVSTLFEIDNKLKRYVGGLVHFDGSTSVYRAHRVRPIIECQLHCLM